MADLAAPPHDAVLEVASALGLRWHEKLSGGDIGTHLVERESGDLAVLKVVAGRWWKGRFEAGTAYANQLHAEGYPCPRYLATGAVAGQTWSLQVPMPGKVPAVMEAEHAAQLVELAGRHRTGRERGYWRSAVVDEARSAFRILAAAPHVAPMAAEMQEAFGRLVGCALEETGTVHGDFHHKNFLADGEMVTAVLDWELATAGDARFDFAHLAFWGALLPWRIPPDVASTLLDAARDACPPDVFAFFVTFQAIRALAADVRHRPAAAATTAHALSDVIAPWWRAVGRRQPATVDGDTRARAAVAATGEVPVLLEDRLDEPLWHYFHERVRIHKRDDYLGIPCAKFPEDLKVYERLLWEAEVDVVVEIGTLHGGSALWFRDVLERNRRYGRRSPPLVISLDLDTAGARHRVSQVDPAYEASIAFVDGDVLDAATVDAVRALLPHGARVLVVEDSAHTYATTTAALEHFGPLVSTGSYLVVEDGFHDVAALRPPHWPDDPRGVVPAIHDFLATPAGAGFRIRRDHERYIVTSHPYGYLERVAGSDG